MTQTANSRNVKSRNGNILYAELPEEYRYRDNPSAGEAGDLEAYLDGFGHVLDMMRQTLEQYYCDGFTESFDGMEAADQALSQGQPSMMQPWIIPYQADLLGADLEGPDPDTRREELANAIDWRKGKGTHNVADEIASVLSHLEAVTVEGWQKTLTTPRCDDPPFSTAPEETHPTADHSARAAQACIPNGTPDSRQCARAVETPDIPDRMHAMTLSERDEKGISFERTIGWDIAHTKGAACFPGAFDDPNRRTPDMGSPHRGQAVIHPRTVVFHLHPPYGFFTPGLLKLGGTHSLPFDKVSEGPDYLPEDFIEADTPVPDRLTLTGAMTIKNDEHVRLRDINLDNTVTVHAGARLTLNNCAVRKIILETDTEGKRGTEPALDARDTLISDLVGFDSFAQLEYVTVLEGTEIGTLHASDCIFMKKLLDFDCGSDKSCIRYSRLSADTDIGNCPGLFAQANTAQIPEFMQFYETEVKPCHLREPTFGQIGVGVLAPSTPRVIADGAEGDGEMGAYHRAAHTRAMTALKRKLTDHLPANIEAALRYDIRLTIKPATVMSPANP